MTRSIFVTGAAAGIGRATALLFARRGFRVGLYDVDELGLARVAGEIGERAAVWGRLDVADPRSVEAAVAAFGAWTGGRMDVLFNCAGILRMGAFDAIPIAEYEKEIAINVLGPVYVTRAALPLLERGERPVIVTMSSASAQYGVPEMAVYSATKFFVRGLTEALDLELAGRGIRVCDVAPGYVATEMVSSQRTPAKSVGKLGVSLTADDVAEVVWKAVHGSGVHHFVEAKVAALARIGGALPSVARRVLAHYSR